MYGRDVMRQEAAGFAWTTLTTSCSLPGVWGMRRQNRPLAVFVPTAGKKITFLSATFNSISASLSFHLHDAPEIAG
jgi:hypothetical protein